MSVSQSSQHFLLTIMMLALVALAGCANVSIDPSRTRLMVAHSVSPKSGDGMTTSETLRCTFKNGPISQELADKYLKDPAQAIKDGACDFDGKRDVVQGSPSLAGQIIVGAANAVSTGLVTYGVQATLQNQQQKHCEKDGGCGTTIVNNNDGSAIAGSNSQSVVDGVKVNVKVGTTCGGKTCLKGD